MKIGRIPSGYAGFCLVLEPVACRSPGSLWDQIPSYFPSKREIVVWVDCIDPVADSGTHNVWRWRGIFCLPGRLCVDRETEGFPS
ncbi:hypothetical protein [Pasteuria penetrans]|uniref:hypothetical protein n=1 Tax=Pasteuria penetrans TaxID=86005 RepID=UPI000F9981AD|nr:hypothetical protein [Pasteuria penetrans]